MTEEQVCPQCGSAESGTGEFKGYGSIFKKKTVLKYSEVDAIFCAKCGYVHFFKVRNPEKIL
ncbi:zinc ribbon domain-containing protein [Bacillus infantis]|uniref:zinc ribbon domain-containing protein n=1 Tax=Bacillus TaxID=1386 RepID=UPI000C779363|nr:MULTISPECIES: zinc ribbon domain-containing protein [Bacillus]MCA1038382.1 zinc ribbon domain-containing protein [Bacillus infantis]MDT0163368.1 zinc ribbon domain-containing protein [Bacillus sp. AG4(2022)]PLR74760.1 hypothetical protein CYJ37_03820 [Bacillus sp. UMB0728]